MINERQNVPVKRLTDTATAPLRRSFVPGDGGATDLKYRCVMTNPKIPIGILIIKIACHGQMSKMRPPSGGPTINPADTIIIRGGAADTTDDEMRR